MGNNVFSIIVPVFNREELIRECLDSIFKQTYRPIEVVVVDDGSTDNTRTVIEDWARRTEELESEATPGLIVEYFFQTNAGASAARNQGIALATGQYVQFLDSDDILYPWRLQSLANVFVETNADFIITGFEGFNAETKEIIERRQLNEHEDLVELAVKGRLWGNTLRCAFRRELVDEMGPWDPTLTCFEDREYSERAVLMAKNPVAVSEISAGARRGGGARQSDRLRTYEGRRCRIECEKRLAERVCRTAEISKPAMSEFASRIYGLGVRSYAMGWLHHGRECGRIASLMSVALARKGKQRRFAWRLGVAGSWAYLSLGWLKRAFLERKRVL